MGVAAMADPVFPLMAGFIDLPGAHSDSTASLPEPFLPYVSGRCNVSKHWSLQPLLLLHQVVLAQHMVWHRESPVLTCTAWLLCAHRSQRKAPKGAKDLYCRENQPCVGYEVLGCAAKYLTWGAHCWEDKTQLVPRAKCKEGAERRAVNLTRNISDSLLFPFSSGILTSKKTPNILTNPFSWVPEIKNSERIQKVHKCVFRLVWCSLNKKSFCDWGYQLLPVNSLLPSQKNFTGIA